jgi:hypothetical protein
VGECPSRACGVSREPLSGGQRTILTMYRLRSHRVAALLVALSLGLGGLAPRVLACDMEAMADGRGPQPSPVGAPADEPCPMHPGMPAAPSPAPERAPAAPAMGCCAAPAAPAPVTERTVQAPAAPVVALLVALVAPPPAAQTSPIAAAAHDPPGPPGPLHLLYGCFLT